MKNQNTTPEPTTSEKTGAYSRSHPSTCSRAIWHMSLPDKFLMDHWTYIEEDIEVEVMAVVDGWVMARRPGCCPMVQPRDNFTFENDEARHPA